MTENTIGEGSSLKIGGLSDGQQRNLFMKFQDPLLRSQKISTVLFLEPDESGEQLHTLFSNTLFFQSKQKFSKFFRSFDKKKLYTFFAYLIRDTLPAHLILPDSLVRTILSEKLTRLYPEVSGVTAWIDNCKWYSSLPLGAIVSLFYKSV
jgi:hypothetical protein